MLKRRWLLSARRARPRAPAIPPSEARRTTHAKRWVVVRSARQQTDLMPHSADAAFADVYTQYLPKVSAYLARRVERDAVEDLAADVFALAWRKRDAVTAGEELPWLYRIAANLVANHRRKVASTEGFIRSLRPADSAPAADDIVIADQNLAHAWKQLRARDREVLALAVFEDLPIGTIAAALGVSTNAVSIRLHRAKKQLSTLLA
jgi:RNA polymerase sigma-70 factor, ECF subfamily